MAQREGRQGFLERLKGILAWPTDVEPVPSSPPPARPRREPPRLRRSGDVVPHPSLGQPVTEVRHPLSRQDVKALGDLVKAGHLLVVDLGRVRSREDKRYIVAFLVGLTYGLEGAAQRVNEDVYIFAPSLFQVKMADVGARPVSFEEWLEEVNLSSPPSEEG